MIPQIVERQRGANETSFEEVLQALRDERERYRAALHWIGREAKREDFEKRWNSVQDIACMALAGYTPDLPARSTKVGAA